MQYFNIDEAKSNFSRLIREVEQGEEIVFQQDGKAVAKLVPFGTSLAPRKPGMWSGQTVVHPAFFEPLSDEDHAVFDGED